MVVNLARMYGLATVAVPEGSSPVALMLIRQRASNCSHARLAGVGRELDHKLFKPRIGIPLGNSQLWCVTHVVVTIAPRSRFRAETSITCLHDMVLARQQLSKESEENTHFWSWEAGNIPSIYQR